MTGKLITLTILFTLAVDTVAQDRLELAPELKTLEEKRIAAIEAATKANVCIFSADGTSGGSGVIIDRSGLALSNFHVVDPCGFHMYCGLTDGKIYDAVVVGIDPVGDLALIQILGRKDFPFAKLGDSDRVRVGESCFATGNPFLLSNDYSPTVTFGIVSGKNRYQYPAGTLLEYADCLQTDAAINPGNSGGPLYNINGILIGVNGRGSFEKRGRVSVGVGYAISINQVKRFIGSLKSGRILDHASSGFLVATGSDNSVRVSKISTDSDAYRKGIRYDAEIISVAGRRIRTANDFKNIMGTVPPHWSLPVEFRLDDVKQTVMLRLESVHAPQELFEKVSSQFESASANKKQLEEIPESVKTRYEARRGYANYFFQRQQVARILDGLRNFYNPDRLELPDIQWSGASSRNEVTFVMNSERSGIRIGSETGTITGNLPFENQTTPQRSGGFLNSIHIFHELVFGGTDKLAVTFLGTAPFVSPLSRNKMVEWSTGKKLNLLRVLRDGADAYFYVDDKFNVVAIEYFPFPESEPAVVEFKEILQCEGSKARCPKRVVASNRRKSFVEFEVNAATIKPARKKIPQPTKKGDSK